MLDDQWAEFQEIWKQRLRHAVNTSPADPDITADAVNKLYQLLGLDKPTIRWVSGPKSLPRAQIGLPLQRLADCISYSFWMPLRKDIAELQHAMGYDAETGLYRINTNKVPLFGSHFRVSGVRGQFSRRPNWSRTLDNMISQFDAPSVALCEFALANRKTYRLDGNLLVLAAAYKKVLDHTFAAILFNNSCLLIDRPDRIALDDSYLISSTNGPAFKGNKTEVYAVNGVIIPKEATERTGQFLWATLNGGRLNPQQRMALIEYIGWDEFMKLVPTHHRTPLDVDPKFGTLFVIRCAMQEIMVVQVTNSTAEPDGSFRRYTIPVDFRLRPLPNPRDPTGVLGAPQQLTAVNAVASTFGMTGDRYAAILGAES
jgi:hypothetical protein